MAGNPAIKRAEGTTPSERYLQRLCEHSFLRLWSYAGVFRDQGRHEQQGDGKELCDLLEVFDRHILIFSVKDCAFRDTGDLWKDWNRWYRSSLRDSAKQVRGAESTLRLSTPQLFLDKACTEAFPIPLPDPARASFHRIVVAHNVADRSAREFGTDGSLRIRPSIQGDEHLMTTVGQGEPFTVGHIDPNMGFVHVLSDRSLDLVMGELDTVTDFVSYLSDKESHIASGQLEFAASEEDLLACYLFPVEGKVRNEFPDAGKLPLNIPQGTWKAYEANLFRLARQRENEVSYRWDDLIEMLTEPVIFGVKSDAIAPPTRDAELALRFLAQEPRYQRRALSDALLDVINGSQDFNENRFARLVEPENREHPYYALLSLRPPTDGSMTRVEYRDCRRSLLRALCEVAKVRTRIARHIVGIATETADAPFRSFDLHYLDATGWTLHDRIVAGRRWSHLDLLKRDRVKRSVRAEFDYPDPLTSRQRTPFGIGSSPPSQRMKGRERNQPCPCGRPLKYKHCCGREFDWAD